MLNSQLCEGVDPILSPAKLLTLEMEKLFGNCFGRLLCVLSVKNGRRTILNVYLAFERSTVTVRKRVLIMLLISYDNYFGQLTA